MTQRQLRRSNRHPGGIILKIGATDYNEDDIGLYLRFGIKPTLPPIAAQPSSGNYRATMKFIHLIVSIAL